MSVLADHWIRDMARQHRMIDPFADGYRRKGKVSFGVSSYGYDFRLADEFEEPDFETSKSLDPKRMDRLKTRPIKTRVCSVGANSFIFGRSLEYFRIPRNVLVLCQGKSTYARCGLVVNITPLEPEWEGYITIALVNTSPLPVRVYPGEGIGQAVFVRSESDCTQSYVDRSGKYQQQKKIQLSKV